MQSGVPDNDNCAGARVVGDGVAAVEGDNFGADTPDDTEAGCVASDNDVWFEYVATCTGSVTVDTSGSGQEDTVLSVYDTCGGEEIACNDNFDGLLAEVEFSATEEQTYLIRVASAGLPGDFDLNVACSEIRPVPTVSEWGMSVLSMLLLGGLSVFVGFRRGEAS